MRSALLAVALALGLGLATTGAQAATVGGNVAVMKTVANAGNSGIVEKAYYRRHWHHRRGATVVGATAGAIATYRGWGWGHHYRHHRYWRRHHYWR